MSAEEFRERLDSALEGAVAGDADLDEVLQALHDAEDRLEQVRVLRGDA